MTISFDLKHSYNDRNPYPRRKVFILAGKFTHNNDGFVCDHCGATVPPATVGCRNHCPHCLTSKHVDIFPGDRANPCKGMLRATNYELDSKKGLVLRFKCDKCGAETRNIANHEDPECPDNYDKILSMSPSDQKLR